MLFVECVCVSVGGWRSGKERDFRRLLTRRRMAGASVSPESALHASQTAHHLLGFTLAPPLNLVIFLHIRRTSWVKRDHSCSPRLSKTQTVSVCADISAPLAASSSDTPTRTHSLRARDPEVKEALHEAGSRWQRQHRQGRVPPDPGHRQQPTGTANDCHLRRRVSMRRIGGREERGQAVSGDGEWSCE